MPHDCRMRGGWWVRGFGGIFSFDCEGFNRMVVVIVIRDIVVVLLLGYLLRLLGNLLGLLGNLGLLNLRMFSLVMFMKMPLGRKVLGT